MDHKFYFTLTSILFVIPLLIFCSCGQIREWTNDPPEINSFTVPKEVEYGDTVQFKVRAFDPEDDTLAYTWDVSDGTLIGEAGPEVQWTAPELPIGEDIAAPISVKVDVYINDGGEETVSKSATIFVFSKAYKVATTFSGIYSLSKTLVNGEPVDSAGKMTLTTTTFTREFETDGNFLSGSYKLIEPFDDKKGTIHWFVDGSTTADVSTYTWDGSLLVLYWPGTDTSHVYQRQR